MVRIVRRSIQQRRQKVHPHVEWNERGTNEEERQRGNNNEDEREALNDSKHGMTTSAFRWKLHSVLKVTRDPD